MPLIVRTIPDMIRKISMLAGVCFLLAGVPAKADEIIYNSLDSNGSFINGFGYPVRSAFLLQAGMSFTPSGDFTVTTIDVGISWVSGPNEVVLELDSAGSNGLPGQRLESWTLENLPPVGEPAALTQVVSNSVDVQSGVKYWLVALPGDPATFAVWNIASQDNIGPVQVPGEDLGETQGEIAAFRVSGVPVGANTVPEIDPSSASTAVTILGGAILVIRGKRRKPF